MSAARLRFLAAGASQGLATAIAREASFTVEGAFGPVDGMRERLLAGEACDVVILTHAQVAELTAGRRVARDVVSDLGAARTSIAAPLAEPHGPATVYTAAVNAQAANPAMARDFIARLTGPGARSARAAAGFEAPVIRRATRADEEAIRAIVFGILAEYALTPDPDSIDRDLYDLEEHYFSHGGMFDVVEDASGRVVACCGTYATNAQASELRKMYVRADQRGHGLGQRLLDRAIAFARARGCLRLELETASVLKEAMAMYEKAGFVRQPHAPHVKRCDRAYSLALR